LVINLPLSTAQLVRNLNLGSWGVVGGVNAQDKSPKDSGGGVVALAVEEDKLRIMSMRGL
jgi:hypothetical protein